jgi:ubiquinone/menaquinone biosynthesis C-methylase UbiE
MRESPEQFLQNFHSKFPGCTPNVYAWGGTETGATSYETILQKIRNVEGPILDVACGDGFLLSEMVKRGHSPSMLSGLDMSQGELKLASQNAQLAGIELINGNARRMPLENERFDAVTCHMALMLIPRVHEVINEVARVLKPEGIFTAFINARGPSCTTREIYHEVLSEYVNLDQQIALKNLTDSRLASPLEIEQLLNPQFHSVDIEDGVIRFKAAPEEILKCFMTMYYSYFLTATQMERMREDLLREFRKIADEDGNVQHVTPYRLITARKRPLN